MGESRNIRLGGGEIGIQTPDTVVRNSLLKCRQNFRLAADQSPNRECRSCELQELAGHPTDLSLLVRFSWWRLLRRLSQVANAKGPVDYLLLRADDCRVVFSTAAPGRQADVLTRTSRVSFGQKRTKV